MTRPARRIATAVGLAAVALVALAGPAAAHTEATAEAATEGRTRITLTVAAECADGTEPTAQLRVQLPEGATDVRPEEQEGWTSELSSTELDWTAPTPGIDQDTFVVEMVLAQPVGDTIYLPTIQVCPDGEELAWIQVPTTPDEVLARPAPSIVVPPNATTPTTLASDETADTDAGPTTTARMALEQTPITQEGSETSTSGLVVFVVVTVVILGGAAILYLRHRNTGTS